MPSEEHVRDDGQQGRHDQLPTKKSIHPRVELPQIHGIPRYRLLPRGGEARPPAIIRQRGPATKIQHRVHGLYDLAAGLQEYGEVECGKDGTGGEVLGDQ